MKPCDGRRLAAGPPQALSAISASRIPPGWRRLTLGLEQEAALQSQAFATDDLKEGAAAFRVKRAPNSSGLSGARIAGR